MNRRNPQAAAANKQMQTMQKIMPILFGYIYFLVPAAVVIYMIVSTMIRIVTQDIMFRTGVVTPANVEKVIGGAKGATGSSGVVDVVARDGKAPRRPAPKTNGQARPAKPALGAGTQSNGNGSTNGNGKALERTAPPGRRRRPTGRRRLRPMPRPRIRPNRTRGPRTSGTEGLVERWSGLRSPGARLAKPRSWRWSSWGWRPPTPRSWCSRSRRWAYLGVPVARPVSGPGFVPLVPGRSGLAVSVTAAAAKAEGGARTDLARGHRASGRPQPVIEVNAAGKPPVTPREARTAPQIG